MDDESSESGARTWALRGLGLLAAAALLAAAVWGVMSFIGGDTGPKKPAVQQIAVLKQPPPPPPKPPEKPPEPQKVKEEVKLDEPKDTPKPEPSKVADDKPASDKPLGVDADGAAGGDSFGLTSNRGGRDLLSTGGGSSGAYYSGLLQRHFFDALSQNRRMLKEEFRVVVKIWLGDDGRVQKADIVSGSGNARVDEMIQLTLLEMSPLKDVPPAAMRPMQLRLANRS